jgi:ubiquinone/menaquinone biosynthesis C-methylase UbiE
MVDHKLVYQQEGELYQRLISREDYQGNLLPALERLVAVRECDFIDLGGGTGRLTSLLAERARSFQAFDLSHHMLLVAAEQLRSSGLEGWGAAVADHRAIPCPDQTADCVISGWSLCYLVVWEDDSWQRELNSALREIRRILRQSGKVIILETLGTGTATPLVPEKLARYYRYLDQLGFHHSWIRTDYRFQDQEEARELVEFFFGPEILEKIGFESQPILAECTGIWWLSRPDLPLWV